MGASELEAGEAAWLGGEATTAEAGIDAMHIDGGDP
jgi:hypothetical protein